MQSEKTLTDWMKKKGISLKATDIYCSTLSSSNTLSRPMMGISLKATDILHKKSPCLAVGQTSSPTGTRRSSAGCAEAVLCPPMSFARLRRGRDQQR
jgi:hypothetical protein